ncbi:hypothetical protein BKA66DRAFT_476504 [Pyrenochaeta sp. MPI-SDFR-AT-0127]|nr:hypothetical protein BKA66DRAFT_476504 [Pyrenochaeta sp. MPI-SDFR-AT-0127]
MSVSDNSTVAVSRDHEGSYQLLDGYAYGVGDLAVNSYEKSPYANAQIVSLDVGVDSVRFDVHGTILRQSAELAAKFDPWSLKKQPVPLPELDEAAAHTLIHYLYTGKFQAPNTHASPDKAVTLGYNLGTCVYCAAIRYKLPGLAELAKEKITSVGEDVSIFDILAIARDHAFPLLPDDEAWYPAYLEGAINSAMAEDPEPFRKPDFITQVAGNHKLLQVVWKTVTSNFARAPVAPAVMEDEALTPTAEQIPDIVVPIEAQQPELVSEAADAVLEAPEKVEESATPPVLDTVPNAATEEAPTEMESTQEDSLKLEDIEPTVGTTQALETFTDELGFETSKMYRQMGRKSDAVAHTETVPEEPKKPTHTQSDSVMQIEQNISSPELEEKSGEAIDVADDSQQVLNAANESTATSKKGKKKKAKKSSIVF